MRNKVLMRLKHTARLEKLIESGASFEEILQQSQKVDKFIADEMKSQEPHCKDKKPSINYKVKQ